MLLLLISDANILLDVEVVDLVAPMFCLGYQLTCNPRETPFPALRG